MNRSMSHRLNALLTCLVSLTGLAAAEPPPWPLLEPAPAAGPLPGTALLEETGDLSRMLHEASDRFLDREIERAAKEREKFWKRDLSSPEVYAKSVQPNRERLAKMLGIDRETRHAPGKLEDTRLFSAMGGNNDYVPYGIRWKAFGHVFLDG